MVKVLYYGSGIGRLKIDIFYSIYLYLLQEQHLNFD